MFPRPPQRVVHYALLTAVWAAVCLPNLGRPSLWDVDEGHNAEAAREMLRSGNHVVPTFNYRLREDKPALLYWLQVGGYHVFGVNEFAARLPSALAALLTVLVTYELGRRMFGRGAALLGGLILASAVGPVAAAHFANPDALLTAFTALTLLVFWHDYATDGRGWLALVGATAGLGVLAKGPVGLVLPVAVTWLFLLWRGQLRRLLDSRVVGVALLFTLVALPWYVWVTLETKGAWPMGFWQRHHAARMTTPLENHGGPPYYYLLVLVAGLAPWSAFLGAAGWHAWRQLRGADDGRRAAVQYLLCWAGVYLVFFSLVRTKLPNYVLPLYPAAALLLGLFLDGWRRGEVEVPRWVMRVSLACLGLMGVGVGAGLLVAGGAVEVPALRGRCLPGLEAWAGLGAVLLAGAAASAWCLARDRRAGLVAAVAGCGVAFTGLVGGWGARAVERYKAPRPLARELPADQLDREVRLAAYAYFRPSLVFYCRREVARLDGEQQALDFLRGPLPSYLFLPAHAWEGLQSKAPPSSRLVARHHDLYAGYDVVVVTNE